MTSRDEAIRPWVIWGLVAIDLALLALNIIKNARYP